VQVTLAATREELATVHKLNSTSHAELEVAQLKMTELRDDSAKANSAAVAAETAKSKATAEATSTGDAVVKMMEVQAALEAEVAAGKKQVKGVEKAMESLRAELSEANNEADQAKLHLMQVQEAGGLIFRELEHSDIIFILIIAFFKSKNMPGTCF